MNFRLILDDKIPELFEKVVKNQISKPLTYYSTIEEAVRVLRTQRYGTIEILPNEFTEHVSYITARVNADKAVQLNVITYGFKVPESGGRPFSIEGSSAWRAGDVIYNSDLIESKVLGWLCTDDGFPGSWEPFGLVNESAGSSSSNPSVPSSVNYELKVPEILGEENLPIASKSKLGKLILYAKDFGSDYSVYICQKVFDENKEILYQWVPLGSSLNSVVQYGSIVQDDSFWKLTKINLKDIDNLEEYLGKFIIGIVPTESRNNQKLILNDKTYSLYYGDSTLNSGELNESDILLFQMSEEVLTGSTIKLLQVSDSYIQTRLAKVQTQFLDSIGTLENRINQKISEINSRITQEVNSLANSISDSRDVLNQSIDILTEKVNNFIVPSIQGSKAGSSWFEVID